jgi:hypothetical protein
MKSKIGEVEIFAVNDSGGGVPSIGVQGPDVIQLETGVVFQSTDGSQWELAVIPHISGSDDPRLFVDRLYVGLTPVRVNGELNKGMVLDVMREGGRSPAPIIGTCVFASGLKTFSGRMTKVECDRVKGIWTEDSK